MRQSAALDALLSPTTQGVRAATLMQPHRWWHLGVLGEPPGRTIRMLEAATGTPSDDFISAIRP